MIRKSVANCIAGRVCLPRFFSKSRLGTAFRILSELLRWRLSLAVTLSGGLGMLLARPVCDWKLFVAVAGIFFGSGATSALNQLQEKKLDRLMSRTKNRPLAAGSIQDSTAIRLTIYLMTLAAFMLAASGGSRALLILGLIVLLYNGLYTPLKTRTGWFLPCGLAAGGLPPVLGWVCGGGIFDFTAMGLFVILLLWQIPHLYWIYSRNREDYRKVGLKIPQFSGQFRLKRIL